MEANMPGDPKAYNSRKPQNYRKQETALPILREPGLGWLKLMQAVLAEDDAEQELEQTA